MKMKCKWSPIFWTNNRLYFYYQSKLLIEWVYIRSQIDGMNRNNYGIRDI